MKYSFEFFPPKSDEMEQKLWQAIDELKEFLPHFVSVTYGAGGSTREKTRSTLQGVLDRTALKPAAHLTCVNATKKEIDDLAAEYWEMGVKHIVALRGDPPDMEGKYEPHPEGYQYASDLVEGLRKVADFEISVAAYPETHPQATSADDDLQRLKEKADAGAHQAITQFFFDVDEFFKFAEKAKNIGVNIPIIPGILPISNYAQAKKFADMCGAKIPKDLADKYIAAGEDEKKVHALTINFTTDMCKKLIAKGFDDLHFYTLNRADLTAAILNNLK